MNERQKACAHCGDEADMTCTGCKVTVYCSRDHQKADWHLHKLFCQRLADFQVRPSPDHRRAILLPEHKNKPRFIWIGTHDRTPGEEGLEDGSDHDQDAPVDEAKKRAPHALPNFDGLFGAGRVPVQTSMLLLNDYTSQLGKNLAHAVYTGHRGLHQTDGSQPNKCIASCCTDERVARRFRGPMVLYGMTSLIKEMRTIDIGPVDFSLAIKLFEEHHSENIYSLQQKEAAGVMVLNPRVATAHGAGPFGDVYVPFQHPVFQSGMESKLSKLVGMPLLTYRHELEEEYENEDDTDEWEMSPAAFLHLNVNPYTASEGESSFGAIPQEWHERSGSVVVVWQDLKPLSAFQVEALCRYSAEEAKTLLMKATEGPDSRRKAVANISKSEWDDFLAEQEVTDGVKKL